MYLLPKPTLQVADTCTGKMGGVNLSINKMEFSLAICQLLLVQLGKFVDTIIFEIVGTHYCMLPWSGLGNNEKLTFLLSFLKTFTSYRKDILV